MKLKTLLIALTATTTLLFCGSIFADSESAANGKKGAGHRGGHGGPSGNFHSAIHSLFANHEKVERSVKLTETGYQATTISDDPAVAKTLKRHVAQMESRLEGGMGIRHWDPAYAELREYYEDIKFEVIDIEKGVRVNVIGKTPDAVKVAQNHAKIVSGFVEKGSVEMHASHSRALGGSGASAHGLAKMEKCEDCGSNKGDSQCAAGKCQQGRKTCCAGKVAPK